jgi:iron-sulfur cluster repair protein YtfE (RIC family)
MGAQMKEGAMIQLRPGMTVNDLLREESRAAAVLNRLGIDTCCGGMLTLEEASRAAGTTAGAIIELVHHAARGDRA